MTEQEMREADAASPKSLTELTQYIEQLETQEHDYGTCVYAMSMAAVAAFNYIAHKLGVTGFQASCADLDILRRTRNYKGPFMVVDSSKMLYPQYNIMGEVSQSLEEWKTWAAEEAGKNLADASNANAHPNVIAHWKKLAGGMHP